MLTVAAEFSLGAIILTFFVLLGVAQTTGG